MCPFLLAGVYRSILIICGKFHKKYEAQVIFEAMKKSGVKPSAVTYGAYAAALAEGTAMGVSDLFPAAICRDDPSLRPGACFPHQLPARVPTVGAD